MNDTDKHFDILIRTKAYHKEEFDTSREKASALCRQIPIKLLALEWFNKSDLSTDTRAYLIENFLPILVLGCEKLLKEAEKRSLIEKNRFDVNFNPINYLAQYLMRNNPAYNNQNEQSPYVRTMREIYHELKEEMFSIQGNKTARIKEDVRKRRTEREQKEKLKQLETTRRKNEYERLFHKFYLSEYGRIEISIVFEAFKLYQQQIENLPDQMRQSSQLNMNDLPSFCYQNNKEINSNKRILKSEFVQLMLKVTDHFSSDRFDFFTDFIEQCSIYFVHLANSNILNRILKHVFKFLDTSNTGYLSRRRLIQVLDTFKQNRNDYKCRNPIDWPVLDPYIKFENKLEQVLPAYEKSLKPIVNNLTNEEQTQKTSIPNKNELFDLDQLDNAPNEEGKNSTEIDVNLPSNQQTKDLENERNNKPSLIDSDDGDLQKVELQTDLNELKPVNKENTNVDVNKSEDKMLSEEEFLDNVKLVKPSISKENELLFLKGGILYYKPLKQELNTFESNLINADNKPKQQAKSAKKSETKTEPNEEDKTPNMSQFDAEFVNLEQFLNLIQNFFLFGFLNSEINVNDLIVFVKDNFAENNFEKMSKLKKVKEQFDYSVRSKKVEQCFDKIDINASESLNLSYLRKVITSYKDGLFAEKLEATLNEMEAEIVHNGKPDENISKEEFVYFVFALSERVNNPQFEDQLLSYLQGLNRYETEEKTRSEMRRDWLNQIKQVGEITYGSFDPLYKQLFFTLLKDSENHGRSKNISAYVGILERLEGADIGLRYHATTPHDSKYMLGKTLGKTSRNISFDVIEKGQYEHIQRVRSNPNVHFFRKDHQNDGSLAVYPLKYTRNKVFGTLSIDTLQETERNNSFGEHEIAFYQGVATSFAKSYVNIIFKNRLIKTCATAIKWLGNRSKQIESCNVYFIHKLDNATSRLNETESNSTQSEQNPLINMKPIMNYLFKQGNLMDLDLSDEVKPQNESRIKTKVYECAINSEITVGFFSGHYSYCIPLRNDENKTIFVVELVAKESVEKFDEKELEQIETVQYVLHKCQEELIGEHFLGEVNHFYEFENMYEQDKFEILFEKCYLAHVLNILRKSKDERIVELMADGTESPENTKTKNLLKLVSDLLELEDLNKNEIISEEFLDALKSYDPTKDTHQFKETSSSFQINKPGYLDNLNSFHFLLANLNKPLKALIDWSCLVKQMHLKVHDLKKQAKQN